MAATTTAPVKTVEPERLPQPPKAGWRKLVIPLVVVLLAAAILATIIWNWNSWEGGRIEQTTDDAYVRGDLTPLSTKVAGIVRDVKVSDFQQVRKGDLLVELQDDDYQAQVAQASAAVGIAGRRRVPSCVMVSLIEIEHVPESGRWREVSSHSCLPARPPTLHASRCFRHPNFQSASPLARVCMSCSKNHLRFPWSGRQ